MAKQRIVILTGTGKLVRRWAAVTDWIGSGGRQYSTATVGLVTYTIIDRTADGPIWATEATARRLGKIAQRGRWAGRVRE